MINTDKNNFHSDIETAIHDCLYVQYKLEETSQCLTHIYNFETVEDIDSKEAHFLCEVIKSLRSFLTVICNEDFCSASILIRSIADRVSILRLVFANNDVSEREYRYYLYMLDGCNERKKLLSIKPTREECKSGLDYLALAKQYQEASDNTSLAVQVCTDKLNHHEYAMKYPRFHHNVLKNSNWRFNHPGEVDNKGKTPKKSWKEMYALITPKEAIVSMYSGYFSQFTHGLFLSILSENYQVKDYHSLIVIAMSLQRAISKELETVLERARGIGKINI